MNAELAALDATDILAGLSARAFSAAELAADLSARAIEAQGLNALTHFDSEAFMAAALAADGVRARGAAEPLCGLPYVVKDNINTCHMPTAAGTGALRGHVPASDAGVVRTMKAAGAIAAAKAGMHELAFGVTSNNAVTGAVRNPHDPSRIPGGSSGGVAAAVAAGIFPVGLGTDTGGSCRIPAALCVVGFRPTTGRYSASGVVPISHTRDTVGPLARSVRDAVLLDAILTGEAADPRRDLRGARLGVPASAFWDDLEPETESAARGALALLEAAGAELIAMDFPGVWAHNAAFSFPVVFYEVMRDLPAYLAEHAPDIGFDALLAGVGSADVAGALRSQIGEGAMPEAAYRAAMDVHRPAMRLIYKEVFQTCRLDAIIFPTTPLRAALIGEDETTPLNGRQVPTFPTYIRNTDLGSNIGAPGLSIPCPVVDSLPVGIEIDGQPGDDAALLSLGLAIEEALRG